MFLIVLGLLCVFALFACNIGSSRKPGHQSYGLAPAFWTLVVVLLGWLLWPAIGPFVTTLLRMFGAHV